MGRARAGGILFKIRLAISGDMDAESQFTTLWKFGTNYRWLFRLREYYSNPYQFPWETFLFIRILAIVNADYANYKPKIKLIGDEIIAQLISARERVILVTIHSFVGLCILSILRDFGIQTTLVAYSDQRRDLELLACATAVDFIPPTEKILLCAREKLKQGRWLVCSVDYPRDWSGLSRELLIGTAIFDFAGKLQAKVVFAAPQVTKTGEISVTFSRKQLSMSPNESAKELITFLNSVLIRKKKWKIRSPDV